MSMSGQAGPPVRAGIPLKDRPANGVAREEPAPADAPARQRWCVVNHPVHGLAQGLVLQWAQDQRGWVALVVFVLEQAGGDVTVQEWLPAARLRAASA
ncbi:MAG: hypothetical protein KDB51_17850 [Propionibacteriaceae bacterium]|nr:hypothetical protein [Propionibacteriaceae bacterium]